MFLYDQKDKTIDVYALTQQPEIIRSYKIEQMKNIPINKIGLFTEEVVPNFQSAPLLFKKDLDKKIISNSELIDANVSLNYNTDEDDVNDLLEWFYSEKYNDRPVARIEDLQQLKYYLIASKYITSRKENDKIIMSIEDIIEIPKSLYLLQLLQQEKFAMLSNEDISEQLSLFNFSYVNNISLNELQKMDACGITEHVYPRIINKANNDKHVLQLLKK